MMAESFDVFRVIGHVDVSPEESERARVEFEWDMHHPGKVGKYPPEIYKNMKISKD